MIAGAGTGAGWGLSPRVRGNQRRVGGLPAAAGSIPACAGEPLAAGFCAALAEVYPRVCGGTTTPPTPPTPPQGLSPRVRGNRRGARPDPDGPGSIPACAGEPLTGFEVE